jgi:hypothetical protein
LETSEFGSYDITSKYMKLCCDFQIQPSYIEASPNIGWMIKPRGMRWARHVAYMGVGRGAYRILVGRRDRRRSLGRPRHRWEDNIKTDPQEVGLSGMDWIELAEDRDRWQALANVVMNIQVSTKCEEFLD